MRFTMCLVLENKTFDIGDVPFEWEHIRLILEYFLMRDTSADNSGIQLG